MIESTDTDDDIVRKCYEASGRYSEPPPGDRGFALIEILRTCHPALHKTLAKGQSVCNDLFSIYVQRDEMEIVAEMVQLGADVNACDFPEDSFRVIGIAASFASLAMVKWLVEHGAMINVPIYGKPSCNAIVGAVRRNKRDVVEYMIAQGAILNFVNAGGLSPLDYTAPGSEMHEYLRSLGAKPGSELPRDHLPPLPEPPKPANDLGEYLEGQGWGTVRVLPIHQLIASEPAIRILHLSRENSQSQELFTDGMADFVQAIPEGIDPNDGFQRTEICVCIPSEWEINDQTLDDPKIRWALEWLLRIARWPRETGGFLRRSTIFANGDPPTPLAPNTKMSGVIVSAGGLEPWIRADGERIEFMTMGPLYAEEMAFERREGIIALLERMSNVPFIVDIDRPCVV